MIAQTTATPTTVADLIDAAITELQRRGLCKGEFVADPDDPNSPCCTDGAIRLAAGADAGGILGVPYDMAHLVEEAESLVVEHIVRAGAREVVTESEETDAIATIAGWTDADNNDLASVIDTLRDIADNAR